VISLVLAEIHDEFVFNSSPQAATGEDEDGSYVGATVVDTKPGYYPGAADQVILGDFASLYPSSESLLFACVLHLLLY
jgi:DNA polymerase elongation subunit (family B)